MEGQPKVSVIIPMYNCCDYIEEGLNSVLTQTVKNIEVICVDDGSTDGTSEILKDYQKKDNRIRIVQQNNLGAGAARNNGFLHAKGEYVYYCDADDICKPRLLEIAISVADKEHTDIVAFNFERFNMNGITEKRKGFHPEWLPVGASVFSWNECPNKILSVLNPTPWNKVYRKSFIEENSLHFEEITSSNDITFSAVSAAKASRIAVVNDSLYRYRIGHAGTITSKKGKNLNNVRIALDSVNRQIQCLPYSEAIQNSMLRFEVDNYLFALKNYVICFDDPEVEEFYNYAHKRFNSQDYEKASVLTLGYQRLYDEFCIVKANDYESLRSNYYRKIVVSLTSYPARIACVSKVLESIYNQERKADEVVLYLAEEQFPQKEKDLPVELLQFQLAEKLRIKWCEDLKPHKKYFFALQEYPEAVVVTVDDDIVYPPKLLDRLFWSYLKNPRAVSGGRTHLIVVDDNRKILPYNSWLRDINPFFEKPSMQLICTGAGGVLYPPHVFGSELFNKEAIKATCLYADDLWLKAMELLYDIPVVAVNPLTFLKYVPGSQEEALWKHNVDQNQNDIQIQQIVQYTDENHGKGILYNKIANDAKETLVTGTEAICELYARNQDLLRREIAELRKKIDGAAKGSAKEGAVAQNKKSTTVTEPTGIGRTIKRVGKTVVPNSLKPFIKRLLLRIPHKTKVSIKRVIGW